MNIYGEHENVNTAEKARTLATPSRNRNRQQINHNGRYKMNDKKDLDWVPESFYSAPGARERYLEAKNEKLEIEARSLRYKLAFWRGASLALSVVALSLWMGK